MSWPAVVIFLLIALLSPRADAQDDPIKAEANRILAEANARHESGDYAQASESYQQLLQLLGESRGWRVYFNLAVNYEAMGDATRAIKSYEAFATLAETKIESDDTAADRKADAEARIARIKSAHGALRITPSDRVVHVKVGAAEPRPAGFTLYLAPGEHRVEIGSFTKNARIEVVTLRAGELVELAAEPAILPLPGPAQPLSPSPDPIAPSTPAKGDFPVGWLALGASLTIASAALPIGMAVHTLNKRDDAEALGTDHPDYPDALATFEDVRVGYYISFAAPAALAIVTTIVVAAEL